MRLHRGCLGYRGETEGKRGNEGSITWLRKGDKQGEDYCDDAMLYIALCISRVNFLCSDGKCFQSNLSSFYM